MVISPMCISACTFITAGGSELPLDVDPVNAAGAALDQAGDQVGPFRVAAAGVELPHLARQGDLKELELLGRDDRRSGGWVLGRISGD
jgi:hypothetical protein